MDLPQEFEGSPEKTGGSIIRVTFYGLFLLLLWCDFFVPFLDPLTKDHALLRVSYPAEKVLLGAFVVCSWLVWTRLPTKFATPKFRSWAGFLSLLVGTLAFLPYAVLVFSMILTTPHRSFPSREVWALYISGVSFGACALVFSFVGKGRVRISGITIGFILLTKWIGIGMALKENGRWP